jgi:hypothetical protein
VCHYLPALDIANPTDFQNISRAISLASCLRGNHSIAWTEAAMSLLVVVHKYANARLEYVPYEGKYVCLTTARIVSVRPGVQFPMGLGILFGEALQKSPLALEGTEFR